MLDLFLAQQNKEYNSYRVEKGGAVLEGVWNKERGEWEGQMKGLCLPSDL